MGTNYYIYGKQSCPHCDKPVIDRSRRLHIGKSSMGWSFSFRGYEPGSYDLYDFDQELGESWAPLGVMREKDWKKAISSLLVDDHFLEDEYGDSVTQEEFWKLVDDKRDGQNHTTYCREDSRNREHGYSDCWLDDKGNSFSKGEFS